MAVMASCNFSKDKSDAYGNFEADEVLVTAEVPGKVISQNMEEGQLLKTGDTICIIDTTDLFLKKEVLIAQKAAIRSKMDNTAAQAAVYRQQKENLLVDKDRFARLLKQKAATQKQYDDIEAGIKVADKQIATALSSNEAISGELNTLDKQLAQVDESIRKCVVTSPVNGTVLEKFLEKGEVASIAKPACKIADMSSLFLRVYIDGTQLSSFKIGGQVDVIVDAGKKLTRSLSGTVTWISASAEFTPKIIQTKEERVDLVYAMKVKVENPDGSLKIAMPGEIRIKK
jgi:HlyD family secretion protein